MASRPESAGTSAVIALPSAGGKKSTSQADGTLRNKKLYAVVNVNINLDRKLLARSAVPQRSSSSPNVPSKKVGPGTGGNRDDGKVGVGNRRASSSDGKAKVKPGGMGNASTPNGTTPEQQSSVIKTGNDTPPTTTPSGSTAVKAIRTPHPFLSSDDKEDPTRDIYMVDNDEDKGGVSPIQVLQERSRGVESGGTVMTNVSRISKPFFSWCGSDTKSEEKPTAAGVAVDEWIHGFCSTACSGVWMVVAMLVVIMCPSVLYDMVCAVFALLFECLRFAMVVSTELWCEFFNEMCEVYGVMCSEYCASGLDIEMWNRRRS